MSAKKRLILMALTAFTVNIVNAVPPQNLMVATPGGGSSTRLTAPVYMTAPIKAEPQNLKLTITGQNGEQGHYQPDLQKAWVVNPDGSTTTYNNVVTISGPYTPPLSVSQGKVKEFATMPNPNYKKTSKNLLGGAYANIQLFGKKGKTQMPKSMHPKVINSRRHIAGKGKAIKFKTKTSLQSPEFTITGTDNNSTGMYDQAFKAAWLLNTKTNQRTYYSDVVEYKQATTPPNVTDKAMKAFATMPNPEFVQATPGGQLATITLYGKVSSTSSPEQEEQKQASFMDKVAARFRRDGMNPPPLTPGPVIPQ